MTNSEKLIRALIDKLGYEIIGLDAKPCLAQPGTGETLYDGGNYKLTEKPKRKLTITGREQEIGKQPIMENVDPNRMPTMNFGESVI